MRKSYFSIIGTLVLFLIGTTSCQNETMATQETLNADFTRVSFDGTTDINLTELSTALVETSNLESNELEILLKMRDEEKLARDVYTKLYEVWKRPIFLNISKAENFHFNAVQLLLNNYGFVDSIGGEIGVYNNIDYLKLYNELAELGSSSIVESFKVGALIEEMDIKDLTESLSMTTNENIVLVFNNLSKGSRNHLRAFTRQLIFLKVVYSPIYLDQATYEGIINSPFERGGCAN